MNETYTVSRATVSSDDNEIGPGNPTKRLSFEEAESDEQIPFSSVSGQLKKKKSGVKPASYMEMIHEAIQFHGEKNGTSIPYIKAYIKENYDINENSINRHLKNAIQKCLDKQMCVRPKPRKGSKENTGMTGRLKMNPEWVKSQQKSLKVTSKKTPVTVKPRVTKETTGKNVKQAGKNFTSLKAKPLAVCAAQTKVKQAKESLLGRTPKSLKRKLSAPTKAKKQVKEAKATNSKVENTKKIIKKSTVKSTKSLKPPEKQAPKTTPKLATKKKKLSTCKSTATGTTKTAKSAKMEKKEV